MTKDAILETMEDSEEHFVVVVLKTGETISGTVELYESGYDNEDDDINPGEATIVVTGTDGGEEWNCTIYEDDIASIEVTD